MLRGIICPILLVVFCMERNSILVLPIPHCNSLLGTSLPDLDSEIRQVKLLSTVWYLDISRTPVHIHDVQLAAELSRWELQWSLGKTLACIARSVGSCLGIEPDVWFGCGGVGGVGNEYMPDLML